MDVSKVWGPVLPIVALLAVSGTAVNSRAQVMFSPVELADTTRLSNEEALRLEGDAVLLKAERVKALRRAKAIDTEYDSTQEELEKASQTLDQFQAMDDTVATAQHRMRIANLTEQRDSLEAVHEREMADLKHLQDSLRQIQRNLRRTERASIPELPWKNVLFQAGLSGPDSDANNGAARLVMEIHPRAKFDRGRRWFQRVSVFASFNKGPGPGDQGDTLSADAQELPSTTKEIDFQKESLIFPDLSNSAVLLGMETSMLKFQSPFGDDGEQMYELLVGLDYNLQRRAAQLGERPIEFDASSFDLGATVMATLLRSGANVRMWLGTSLSTLSIEENKREDYRDYFRAPNLATRFMAYGFRAGVGLNQFVFEVEFKNLYNAWCTIGDHGDPCDIDEDGLSGGHLYVRMVVMTEFPTP